MQRGRRNWLLRSRAPILGREAEMRWGWGRDLEPVGLTGLGMQGSCWGRGVLSVSGVASSLEGARKGVLRVPVVAGNGMWGTHANKLICREVCATS